MTSNRKLSFDTRKRLEHEITNLAIEIELFEKDNNIKIILELDNDDLRHFNVKFNTLIEKKTVVIDYKCPEYYPLVKPIININYDTNDGLKNILKCLFENIPQWTPAISIFRHVIMVMGYINTYEEQQHREMVQRCEKFIEYLGTKFNVPDDISNIIINKIHLL